MVSGHFELRIAEENQSWEGCLEVSNSLLGLVCIQLDHLEIFGQFGSNLIEFGLELLTVSTPGSLNKKNRGASKFANQILPA